MAEDWKKRLAELNSDNVADQNVSAAAKLTADTLKKATLPEDETNLRMSRLVNKATEVKAVAQKLIESAKVSIAVAMTTDTSLGEMALDAAISNAHERLSAIAAGLQVVGKEDATNVVQFPDRSGNQGTVADASVADEGGPDASVDGEDTGVPGDKVSGDGTSEA